METGFISELSMVFIEFAQDIFLEFLCEPLLTAADVHAIIVFYDLTDAESFQHVKTVRFSLFLSMYVLRGCAMMRAGVVRRGEGERQAGRVGQSDSRREQERCP